MTLLETNFMQKILRAIFAKDAPPRTKPSNYPEPFASSMSGRIKQPLGDIFNLKKFGINLTTLPPNSVSALHHTHSLQEEFIYILEGEPTLYSGSEVINLKPGMIAGFTNDGIAHHLRNDTTKNCLILEIGDRVDGDTVSYPSDDLIAILGDDGKWQFTHKDDTPY